MNNSQQTSCNNCNKPIHGRADKKFCNDQCRNSYNNLRNRAQTSEVQKIKRILLRNRKILSEKLQQKTFLHIDWVELASDGFRFDYITQLNNVKPEKIAYYCYEYCYLEVDAKTIKFSNLKSYKMPNWCLNIVDFKCDEQKLVDLEELINGLIKKEQETQHGQLPPFGTFDSGWLFYTSFESGVLYYHTKWAPNVVVIKAIADHYNIGFTYSYEEMGMQIYGEYKYIDGILTDTCLDDSDFDQYEYDEERDIYLFEGDEHDSDTEILETLLERKKKTL